jgi:hypothetical protein
MHSVITPTTRLVLGLRNVRPKECIVCLMLPDYPCHFDVVDLDARLVLLSIFDSSVDHCPPVLGLQQVRRFLAISF